MFNIIGFQKSDHLMHSPTHAVKMQFGASSKEYPRVGKQIGFDAVFTTLGSFVQNLCNFLNV